MGSAGDFDPRCGRRGTTQRLRGEILRIGDSPELEIRVSPEPCVADRHATLHRRGDTYELLVEPGQEIWVNGEKKQEAVLTSGDLLEIGRDGPILRYRLYPPGSNAAKTFSEAFSDCVDCARYSTDSRLNRAALFLAGAPKEMATQTSVAFRITLVLLLGALVLTTGYLASWSLRLERRLSEEVMRVEGISQLLQGEDNRKLAPEELEAVRFDVSTALERVQALEDRSEAPARIVASASESVVLLQGAYGFVEPNSGLSLRFVGIGEDGLPLRSPEGSPLVALGGDGPILESFFTGTGQGGLSHTDPDGHGGARWLCDRVSRGTWPVAHQPARGSTLGVRRCRENGDGSGPGAGHAAAPGLSSRALGCFPGQSGGR